MIEGNAFVDGTQIFGELGDATIIRGNDFSGPSLHAISIWTPTNALLEGNTMNGRRDAIRGVMGAPVIRGNTISDSSFAAIAVSQGEATVSENVLEDNDIAISWSGQDGLIDQNAISGGAVGIVIGSDSPSVRDNAVVGAEGRGIAIGFDAKPVLSGNTVCSNGENLFVADKADPAIDETNEICADEPAA